MTIKRIFRAHIIPATGLALLVSACSDTSSSGTLGSNASERQEQNNIQLVLDMWKGVITDASPEAVLKYISPDYIQHNVTMEDGQKALYDAVSDYDARRQLDPNIPPHTTKRLINAFGDGDLVVLIWEMDIPEPSDSSKTYIGHSFDMFRVANGLIVEHWDTNRK